jgi:Domain of unknown function (DUF6766)
VKSDDGFEVSSWTYGDLFFAVQDAQMGVFDDDGDDLAAVTGVWARWSLGRAAGGEFIAVAAIVGLSICLRQRGSAESKPVAEAHRHTSA